MPRNGSGKYSLPTNAWNPAINGVSATPADWQALINDVAAAIQASVSADGQTPITGNLQMDGHLLTGVGAPSGAGMSLRWEQLTRGADIPSASSITIPLEGQFFAVTGSTAITGFGATIAGRLVYIKFDAGIVLTNSASFILPGGANITTQADDYAIFIQESTGVWRCIFYQNFVKLGTAATSDITTSATDSTAGRVTKIGDFGIGAKSAAPLATNADDWLMANGIYKVADGTLGTLPENYGSLLVSGSPTNWASQTLMATTGNVYHRFATASATWTAWLKIYKGPLPDALTGTATIPSLGFQTGNFVLNGTHGGMQVTNASSGPVTYTVAAGAPTGCAITIVSLGGAITLANQETMYWVNASGTLLGGNRTLGLGVVTLLKYGPGSWILTGQGIS